MELSHGAPVGILISSLFFTVLHLTKGWALAGMIPIIFGAGILLGSLALSRSFLLRSISGLSALSGNEMVLSHRSHIPSGVRIRAEETRSR
jgi:hypothetical protein